MSLQGHLLVSHPQMMDPNFHHTVVLITKEENDGASGLILNRAGPVTTKNLWKETFKEEMDVEGWVHSGGPVYGGKTPIMALHKNEKFSEQMVTSGVFLTFSKPVLRELMKEEGDCRIFLGSSGWQPGQLENELNAGVWFLAEPDTEDLFYTYGEDLYKKCMTVVSTEIMNAMVPELTRDHFKNAPNN